MEEEFVRQEKKDFNDLVYAVHKYLRKKEITVFNVTKDINDNAQVTNYLDVVAKIDEMMSSFNIIDETI